MPIPAKERMRSLRRPAFSTLRAPNGLVRTPCALISPVKHGVGHGGRGIPRKENSRHEQRHLPRHPQKPFGYSWLVERDDIMSTHLLHCVAIAIKARFPNRCCPLRKLSLKEPLSVPSASISSIWCKPATLLADTSDTHVGRICIVPYAPR